MTDRNNKKDTSYLSLTGFHRAVPIILVAFAVFICLCFIMQDSGTAGRFISRLFLGLFSVGAYAIPVLLVLHAIYYSFDLANKMLLSRIFFSLGAVVATAAFAYAITYWGQELVFAPEEFYKDGLAAKGGGYIGSIVAYGIITVVGRVGLIILTCTALVLYILFYFSKSKRVLSKFFTGILRRIVFACARTEKKIKDSHTSRKASKKQRKSDAKKNAELGADDFFEVDNGLKTLEITELGILETRSNEDLEARPTLQSRVHHKSAYDGAEEPSDIDNEVPEREYVRSDKKIYTDAFDVWEDPSYAAPSAETPESTPAYDSEPIPTPCYPTDEDADSVFTSDFDPLKLASSEAIAAKPSSRVKEEREYPTVAESISGLTEEDAKRALAREAFERRKAEIIASRRSESVPTHRGDAPAPEKRVEFTSTASESFAPAPSERPDAVTMKIEKTESPKREKLEASYEMHFGTPEPEEETVYTEPAYTAQEPTYTAPVYEKEEPIYTAPSYTEPSPVASTFVTSEPETKPEAEPVFKPYTPPTVEEPEEIFFGLENEGESEIQEPDTLYTERTPLSAFAPEEPEEMKEDEDEPIDEYGEPTEPEEDRIDEDEPEAIPPEEQNPAIKSYQNMFTMFRGSGTVTEPETEDEAEDEAEDEPEVIVEETDTDEEPETYEEFEERDEVLPEDDEPPFEYDEPDEDYDEEPEEAAPENKKPDYSDFELPPIDLLGLDPKKDDEQLSAEIKENTRILIETLDSFNVMASIKGVDIGPRITRYEVVPARGVKVREITGRFEDIELNLAVAGVRMEAPIPGKSAIGFEIPNKNPKTVRLRELLETDEFRDAPSPTFVSIGKDVAGNPIFGDIAKYPHALICGATGMGKSVCINAIMMSMLYKSKPDKIKFIMIDPKKVEFKIYSGIPHLLIPVITEAKQAAGALMWAVEEMERRYELIEKHYLRNIDAYNEKVEADPSLGEPVPKIIIVIDELSDLMMQVRDPVEDLILRIAQKARAAGIHLVIGTQRPSVQVITGNIKANIPTRISCKVSSQTDSRTVFDMGGAEKLLSKGDMLYWPVDRTAPLRVQGAFVSDSEVEAVIKFLKNESSGEQYDESVLTEINKAAQKCGNKKSQGGFDDDDEDDDDQPGLYNDQRFLDAVELAIRSKKVSTSLLQRKLSIGYGKAAKYIDAMESIGIVSEPNGNRPRDILISMDEWHEKLSRVDLD